MTDDSHMEKIDPKKLRKLVNMSDHSSLVLF